MTIHKTLTPYFLSVFIAAGFGSKTFAQGNLMKNIAIGEIKEQRIATVLDKIASKGDFYFAYNNKSVPADSIVSVSNFHGTLFTLLDKLLGEDYEFKEVPGYVVLRHAPSKLYLTADVEKDANRQFIVKGFVKDVADQKVIRQASVYEKNLLISTLTDDKGYFELKLKNYNGPLLITVTRENYRDTSMYVLPSVNVASNGNNTVYKYYPEDAGGNGVERSRFARFFISSKQLVQGLNLGNFFALSPYQISLTPGLSSHGMYSSQVVNHFSLNYFGGYTAGVNGFEVAGFFNIDRKDVKYFQAAGLFNVVGGSMKGFQAAAVYNNVLNNATGMQVGGLINKSEIFKGMQIAGLFNVDKKATGFVLAGLFNHTKSFDGGLQFAGLANSTGNAKGLQFAGLFNRSTGEAGSQFAGLVNVAKKVKGFQFAGLVNIADSSDYPIGIINFIKNGEKSIAVSTDENQFTHLDFRSGGRVLYGLIGVGHKFGDSKINNTIDLGFGAHIVNKTMFSLSAEYVSQIATDFKDVSYQTNSFKILPGINFSNNLRLFAGPSINFISADVSDHLAVKGWVLKNYISGNNINILSIGLTGGLQVVW